MKTKTPSLLTVFCLAFVVVSHRAEAVSPPPDGAYPNFTTAEGQNALQDLTSGSANTALGAYSLFSTTTGSFNTAVGAGALDLNTGDSNTAVGVAALLLNTGTQNTAVGVDALELNTTGDFNAAVGALALFNNTEGTFNSALGQGALASNTTGGSNTASGAGALFNNTTSSNNTAIGFRALNNHTTTGNGNTAIGSQALNTNTTGQNNTAVGFGALPNSMGSDNIAIGAGAGQGITTGDNNIDIGVAVPGSASDVGVIRLGSPNQTAKCFIASIRGVQTGVMDAVPVLIDSGGQLGTASSSRRFKKEIKPMATASEAILALKPVTFHYKSDKTNTPQFGLIAEEVAAVNPDLVVRDKNGEIYTVRYDQVNAMVLNEFLKEHKRTEKLEATVASLIATVKEQAAQIQKVSAQLEVSKPAPQTAQNTD